MSWNYLAMRRARQQPKPFVADWLRLRNQRMAAMRFDPETYHQAGVSALRPPTGCASAAGGLNSEKYVHLQFFTRHNRPPRREKKMREAVVVSYARTGLAQS